MFESIEALFNQAPFAGERVGEVRLQAHEDLTGAACTVKGNIEKGARDIKITHNHVLEVVVLDGVSKEGSDNEFVEGLIDSGSKSVHIGIRRLRVTASCKSSRSLVIGTITMVFVLDEHATVNKDCIMVTLGIVKKLQSIVQGKDLREFFLDCRGSLVPGRTIKSFTNTDFPCEWGVDGGGGIISRVSGVVGSGGGVRGRAE